MTNHITKKHFYSKNRLLILAIAGFLVAAAAFALYYYLTAPHKQINQYPDKYFLREDEIPAGFVLTPVDESAKKQGQSNPGPVKNIFMYGLLYPDVNQEAIQQFYMASYSKPEKLFEKIGIFAVKYKSVEELDQELEGKNIEIGKLKIIPNEEGVNEGLIYLRDGDVLVLLWCDTVEGYDYTPELHKAASAVQSHFSSKSL
ncbi:hypothetical protein D6821_01780 [Candidatus Parcubacteria bacterium]|nr:MAG: hypothetical protein D6821_01780 [Candidatus Parcubacteria bacterium]